jgi:hypothetical protein
LLGFQPFTTFQQRIVAKDGPFGIQKRLGTMAEFIFSQMDRWTVGIKVCIKYLLHLASLLNFNVGTWKNKTGNFNRNSDTHNILICHTLHFLPHRRTVKPFKAGPKRSSHLAEKQLTTSTSNSHLPLLTLLSSSATV